MKRLHASGMPGAGRTGKMGRTGKTERDSVECAIGRSDIVIDRNKLGVDTETIWAEPNKIGAAGTNAQLAGTIPEAHMSRCRMAI
jgi:hypothetical protein